MFQPSKYQSAIFEFVANGNGHGIVNAVAGSGKTTTNIQALQYVSPNKRVVFLAFNKHIADELKNRGVNCASTFHSLGRTNITNSLPKAKFDQYKAANLLDRIDYLINDEAKSAVLKLLSLLKANLLQPNRDTIERLCDQFDIEMNGDEATIINRTTQLFEACNNDNTTYDFDDMIYWSAIGKVGCKQFDFLFVDECQDLNKAQITMAENSMAQQGRMLLIGDPYQSIYAFRGAFNGIMDYMQQKLQATVLPLSVSYRAPKAIVKLVNENFGYIAFEQFENAKDGYITNLDYRDLTEVADEGDAVICRTNAPLVRPAFQLLKEGRKAVILGRDIGDGLLSLIKRRAKLAKVNTVEDLIEQLYIYLRNETPKLQVAKKLSKLATLTDQIETIVVISDGCETISELTNKIQSIFSNTQSGVVFSSIHKAKGLEWNNVFILKPEQMPHPMAESEVDKQQEMNIKYVAYTRTRENLYLVRGGK